MAKRKVKAREITDAEPRRVALVHRGANGIPFRIIKEDDTMGIDLSAIGLFKSQAAPALTGLIVNKDVSADVAEDTLQKAGFSVTNKTEASEAWAYGQADVKTRTSIVIKANDNLGLEVANPGKRLVEYKGFEVLGSGPMERVFPGVRIVMDSLGFVIENAIDQSESEEQARSAIEAAFNEARKYLLSLAASVPSEAMKAMTLDITEQDESVQAAKTEAGSDAVEPAQQEPSAQEKAATEVEAPEVQSKSESGVTAEGQDAGNAEEAPSDTVSKSAEAGDEGDQGAPSSEPTSTDVDSEIAQTVKTLEGLVNKVSDQLSGMNSRLDAQEETVNSLREATEEVKSRTASVEKSVSGVVAGEPNHDPAGKRTTAKSSGGAPPLMDTGFGHYA